MKIPRFSVMVGDGELAELNSFLFVQPIQVINVGSILEKLRKLANWTKV